MSTGRPGVTAMQAPLSTLQHIQMSTSSTAPKMGRSTRLWGLKRPGMSQPCCNLAMMRILCSSQPPDNNRVSCSPCGATQTPEASRAAINLVEVAPEIRVRLQK